MPCGCDTKEYSYPLMSGLMGTLASGSQVSVGFAYESAASRDDVNAGRDRPAYIQNTLVGNLLEFGIFDSVAVFVEEPWLGGYVADGYITVKGITRAEQGSSQNISGIVERQINDYLPFIQITRRDPVVIEAIPQGAQGRSGIEQPNIQQVFPPQNRNVQLPPGECDLDKQDFGDWVACQLGIDSAIGAASAGAIGALLGVGVITVLAVALLKR